MAKKFSANQVAQKVYETLNDIIADLSKNHAIEVLETIMDHFEVMLEGLREELYEENK